MEAEGSRSRNVIFGWVVILVFILELIRRAWKSRTPQDWGQVMSIWKGTNDEIQTSLFGKNQFKKELKKLGNKLGGTSKDQLFNDLKDAIENLFFHIRRVNKNDTNASGAYIRTIFRLSNKATEQNDTDESNEDLEGSSEDKKIAAQWDNNNNSGGSGGAVSA